MAGHIPYPPPPPSLRHFLLGADFDTLSHANFVTRAARVVQKSYTAFIVSHRLTYVCRIGFYNRFQNAKKQIVGLIYLETNSTQLLKDS